MTEFQRHLAGVCEALNLECVIPFQVAVGDNLLFADVLIKNLGAPAGMLIFTTDEFWELRDLIDPSYGYCRLSEDNLWSVDAFIRVFADWSWSGNKYDQPDWIIES